MDANEMVQRAQADDGRSAEELVAAYRAGCGALRASVAGMDEEALRARPIARMMSTLEVLCHLADCEQFLADRMKRTIGTELPLLVGVDASPYLERLHYHDRDPELQLGLFEVTREQMAADLDRIGNADWQRTAIHTETGLVTLRGLVLHAIRHLDRHLSAIAEKRASFGETNGDSARSSLIEG